MVELVQGHLAKHDTAGWCGDAREGFTNVLRRVGERFEAAGTDFDGRYSREG